jgi:tetratricopeptide (TPR) repeat protein
VLDNEAEALNALGRFAEARMLFERALDISQKARPDPTRIAMMLTGLGLSLVGGGYPESAVAPLEHALRLHIDTHETADHLGETRFALARALWAHPSDRPRPRPLAEQARADYLGSGVLGARQLASNAGSQFRRPTLDETDLRRC